MFLVFLEDKADSVPHFVEGELPEGLLVDARHGVAVFVPEVKADVLRILDQGLFLLHEEVGVLGHALIGISLLPLSFLFVSAGLISDETDILEVLIYFLEVEELALDIEGSHVIE